MNFKTFGTSLVLSVGMLLTAGVAQATTSCPGDGTVRFGVEPYESSARMIPVYKSIGDLISKQLGCPVEVFVATSYNAEIEAMRSNKLDIGQFGPLGYVLAHKVAHAEAVATFADTDGKPSSYTASIVTWKGSGLTKLADVAGQSFAFSDPSSTSGHLFPAYALKKAGIDPESGVRALYAGSHTASFEAIRNHKVKAGELNSEEIESAKLHNAYDADAYVTLWLSDPIPIDPIAIRASLPADFKARLTKILQNLDLHQLPEDAQKFMVANAAPALRTVPQVDAAYDPIRALVSTLHIDLNKL